jgi:serine/threonine protein kinase
MGILPGYQDAVEIGGGAFASVYRAVEIDTGRPVALKILKVDSVHPHLAETFSREMQALARVSDHPNIVTLYRPLATPDGRPVLVLELCRESLAQQVRRAGPLTAPAATTVGIKIAGALETAHRHGFLHRDMKPQNVLVTQFGEPALGDFGVAALQASAQATAGVFGFTTLHAAPEMLEGHHLSAAADVYGLASTMYQFLTGLAPFAAFNNEAPASVILRIIRDPVRPLRAADIPIGLSDLLEAALSKDPGHRPGSAVEFADALVAVEAAAGWPRTSYVVWGQGGLASSPAGPAPPTEAGAAFLPTLPPPPPPRPTMTPPATMTPPPPPPPTLTPPPLPPPTLSPPAEPAPSAAQPGPSVAAPTAGPRRVLMPDRADAGPVHPVEPATDPRPYPLSPPPRGAGNDANRPARPVFVDPPAPSYRPESGVAAPLHRPDSVYEETILPSPGAPSTPAREATAGDRAQHRAWSPLLIAGMVSAALVVVAALLLVFGVV